MEYSKIIKYVISAAFVLFLAFGFIESNSLSELKILSQYLLCSSDEYSSIAQIETQFTNDTTNQKDYVNLSGRISKFLDMRGLYRDLGIYVTEDQYIISRYPQTSTDYEYEQTTSFYQFLQDNQIPLLYVNLPVKYIDDSCMLKESGLKSYSNRNVDRFLRRIGEAGVPYLDLREKIKDENLNSYDLFYRTDHHWTTKAGWWAARHITESMNQQLEHKIDTDLYDISNFEVKEWKNCWLGEQGRKIAKTYIGLDDYTEIKPKFATDYSFLSSDGEAVKGTFDTFINEDIYDTEKDVYENGSWHYSYSGRNCINNKVRYGNVLYVCDSYGVVTEPFISLGVHQMHYLVLRNQEKGFSLRQYILDNQIDFVLICYAQFMIGSHDNGNSANYRMFTFDE